MANLDACNVILRESWNFKSETLREKKYHIVAE